MRVFQQTEITLAFVTIVKNVVAANAEEAQELFDNGDGEQISESVGDISSIVNASIRPL